MTRAKQPAERRLVGARDKKGDVEAARSCGRAFCSKSYLGEYAGDVCHNCNGMRTIHMGFRSILMRESVRACAGVAVRVVKVVISAHRVLNDPLECAS